MSHPDLISVVVTTYNRSDALALVLRALAQQDDRQFEVIVADDGSSALHQQRIQEELARSSVRAVHIWHPDVGFTAARVRNRGVAQSRGDYVVFLDGDCVPEPDFVRRHRALAQARCFVNGSRVLLSQRWTDQLLRESALPTQRSLAYWAWRRLRGDANKFAPRLRLGLAGRQVQPAFVWRGIRSCNMGVWRQDFEHINGFDESFVGWGHEDADFVLRLHNAGVARLNGFWATEVYHLWHREAQRASESVNAARVRERMANGQSLPTIGYSESKDCSDAKICTWG